MNNQTEYDFQTVVLKKSSSQVKKLAKNNPNFEQVSTTKYNSGKNQQHESVDGRKADDEDFVPAKKIELSLGKTIAQARTAKGWTQKDLAQKINEKPAVVNTYENGSAVPSQQILGKLERNLGVKLRGKNIGDPIEPKCKK
jgi:putative transcription factor